MCFIPGSAHSVCDRPLIHFRGRLPGLHLGNQLGHIVPTTSEYRMPVLDKTYRGCVPPLLLGFEKYS